MLTRASTLRGPRFGLQSARPLRQQVQKTAKLQRTPSRGTALGPGAGHLPSGPRLRPRLGLQLPRQCKRTGPSSTGARTGEERPGTPMMTLPLPVHAHTRSSTWPPSSINDNRRAPSPRNLAKITHHPQREPQLPPSPQLMARRSSLSSSSRRPCPRSSLWTRSRACTAL